MLIHSPADIFLNGTTSKENSGGTRESSLKLRKEGESRKTKRPVLCCVNENLR
jgi:hypothetical protein